MNDVIDDVSFQREALSATLIDELKPILEEHYQEIAHYLDIPLKPDFNSYWDAERAGILRLYIVRKHGEPIGYNVVFMRKNMHYSTSAQAAQDILYVLKEYRGEGIGRRLITFSNNQLAIEGVQVLAHHVKVAHPALGHILETEGFELVEYVYTKRLDTPAYPSYDEHMANIRAWEDAQ
jgi:GNAT superfamily N-acetyltransferase